MSKLIKKLKLSIGINTLAMAALFVAATYAFTTAFKAGIAGNDQLTFNVVMFPILVGFLLTGYCRLVSRKFNSLMSIAEKTNEPELTTYLDGVAIIKRLPILLSIAVIALSCLLVFSQAEMIMELNSIYFALYSLGQSSSILIVYFVAKRSFAQFK